MFQMFQYFIKGIITTLYTVIVLTNSQLLTCNSINQWRIYRISFRGGGGGVGKVEAFAWRKTPSARGEATRFLGGFGGMLPRENL